MTDYSIQIAALEATARHQSRCSMTAPSHGSELERCANILRGHADALRAAMGDENARQNGGYDWQEPRRIDRALSAAYDCMGAVVHPRHTTPSGDTFTTVYSFACDVDANGFMEAFGDRYGVLYVDGDGAVYVAENAASPLPPSDDETAEANRKTEHDFRQICEANGYTAPAIENAAAPVPSARPESPTLQRLAAHKATKTPTGGMGGM